MKEIINNLRKEVKDKARERTAKRLELNLLRASERLDQQIEALDEAIKKYYQSEPKE